MTRLFTDNDEEMLDLFKEQFEKSFSSLKSKTLDIQLFHNLESNPNILTEIKKNNRGKSIS